MEKELEKESRHATYHTNCSSGNGSTCSKLSLKASEKA